MVFTHLPANLCLIAAALAPTLEVALGLLLVRSLLSQMDVPACSSLPARWRRRSSCAAC
jgi:hypothetical protein